MLNFRLGDRGRPDVFGQEYDLIIVGGGPGGLSAALYAARSGLKTIMVDKGIPGGQMATTERIENCPGCIEGSGAEIGEWMRRQATGFGANWLNASVEAVRLLGDRKTVVIDQGELNSRALIIATGSRPRHLGVPGEERFWGRGVSVCATCDGPFTQGQTVSVVGGGDSALKEGDYLTRFAEKVIILHRRDELRADRANQRRALANPKMEIRYNVVVERIVGDEEVRGVEIGDVTTGEVSELPVNKVFVYIGMIPNTDLFRGQVELDEWGFIRTDNVMATSVPGVYAVGDVRAGAVRQIVTAAADGAVAAMSVDEYLSEHLDEEAYPSVSEPQW